jgi:hypothetical protein
MELIFMLPVILSEGRKDSEDLRFLDHHSSGSNLRLTHFLKQAAKGLAMTGPVV